MVVWGGATEPTVTYLNDGARYGFIDPEPELRDIVVGCGAQVGLADNFCIAVLSASVLIILLVVVTGRLR
jgi:hypothetical protein